MSISLNITTLQLIEGAKYHRIRAENVNFLKCINESKRRLDYSMLIEEMLIS
jgi:hypothetical protein